MTTIFIIDDDPNRHLQHTALINDLELDGYIGTISDNDRDAEANAKASLTIDSMWTRPYTIAEDSIFLIDFTFETNFSTDDLKQLADGLANKLSDLPEEPLSKLITEHLNDAQQALGQDKFVRYYPAIVACAILKARDIPLIVISSVGFEAAETLAVRWGLPVAASSAPDAWRKWKDAILELQLHTDPHIRSLLTKYKAPIKAYADAWNHGWCQKPHGLKKAQGILENSCSYEQLPSKEVKALFRRDDRSWKLIHPENIVSSATLRAALSVLEIKANIDCAVFEFPTSPGIAFLISLKELLNASSDKGPPESVRFFALPTDAATKGGATVFGVQIVFPAKDDNPDGLGAVLRLLEKLKKAGADSKGPAGGLAEGIWNLGHCRSNGIRASGQEWAEMFAQGSPYWLAWPSFAENSVTFHWQNQ